MWNSIKGDNDQFLETTSRAHGFIQTPAVDMLADLFLEKVLKVLEKYVVNLINWGEPLKSDPQHTISPSEIFFRRFYRFYQQHMTFLLLPARLISSNTTSTK